MSGIGLTPLDAVPTSKRKKKRAARRDKQARPVQFKAEPAVVTFDIPTPKLSKLVYWVIALLIAAAIGYFISVKGAATDLQKRTRSFISSFSSNLGSGQHATTPTFKTLAPEDGSKSTTALAYDQQKSLASYADKIAGVDIIVSQQTLPDTFKKHPQQEVENLAKSFNANEIITTADIKAFYGASADGSTVALFTKKDLLVFIRAKKAVEKEALANYIAELK